MSILPDLISVIIPVYKTADYLPRCIESVLAQTYSNLEVLLVDDGSPDNSGKICDEYSKKDNRIKVIHQKNQGVSVARNSGLRIAKGDYIGFVDSDDYISPNMYESLHNLIKETNADMAQCRYQKKFLDGRTEPYKYIIDDKVIFDNKKAISLLFEGPITFTGYNKLYSKQIIKNVFFPTNTGMCEDLVFVYFALKQTNKIAITNEIYYNYCMEREDSATKLSLNLKGALKAFDILIDDLNFFYPELIKIVNMLKVNRLNNIYDQALQAIQKNTHDLALCNHLINWSRLELKHRFKELVLNSDCPKYRLIKSFFILVFPNFTFCCLPRFQYFFKRKNDND